MELPSMTSIGTFAAIIWPFFAVAFITTVLRLYTRIAVVKAFGLDDALILVGQVILFLSLTERSYLQRHSQVLYKLKRSFSLPLLVQMQCLICRQSLYGKLI